MDFAQKIRVIEDFPKPGISFKDITSLLKDGETYHAAIDALADKVRTWKPELIIGPEARGFLLGAPLAYALGVGFVPVRKPGKLPGKTVCETYELEYGSDTLEVHAADLHAGQRIAIVDDLLATGGTMLATARLAEKIGAEVVGMSFLIELSELGGREKIKNYPIFSLVQY